MEAFALWLVNIVHTVGYPGIFIAMALGNALIPIPVEAIMIPAGYLVQQKEMHFAMLMGSAIIGDITGSLFSYYIAFHFGRRVLLNYGKHFFFGYERMEMLDKFFASHGEISTLTGRLVPGLRHFMAFPAGLSHMNVKRFILYTGLGGGIWTTVLIGVGYLIGDKKEAVRHYMPYIEGIVIAGVICMIIYYVKRHRKPKTEIPHDNA